MHALGFCEPYEAVGTMRPIKGGPYEPYSIHLASKGLFETYQEDRASREPGRFIVNADHDSPFEGEDHEDGYLGEHAVKWLQNAPTDYPWFHQVNFLGPHDPFDPPTSWAETTRDRAVPDAVPADFTGKADWVANEFRQDEKEAVTHSKRQYAAHCAFLDDYIGKMIETLKASGQYNNTVVIFTSDHGEMLGDFGLYTKSFPYEGSVRIPLVISGPGIASGHVHTDPVDWVDLHRTVLDLAQCRPTPYVDSRSLLPVLEDPTQKHRDFTISRMTHWSMIRTNEWKLVTYPNLKPELYHLSTDPGERRNCLVDPSPEERAMATELGQKLRRNLLEDEWLR